MADRNRPHIVVSDSANPEQYQRPKRTIPPLEYPRRNRRQHGRRLRSALNSAAAAGRTRRDAISVRVESARLGIYFRFDSFADSEVPLKLESLESSRAGIEVVNVRVTDGIQSAVVFVPDGQVKYFLNRFEQYLNEATEKGTPRHKNLVESIGDIRLATFRELWTDSAEIYPETGEPIWWEVWLRRTDGREAERLRDFAEESGIGLRGDVLTFPNRIVLLAFGPAETLAASLDVLNDIAELRRAKEPPEDFLSLAPIEQAHFVEDLAGRLVLPNQPAPSVCILDTGVNRGHPLLEGSLEVEDCQSYEPGWGPDDRRGHGTQMAGLALLGDLAPLLSSGMPVPVHHVLESVKILPNVGANPPELYGHVTTEAAARAEVQAPDRKRVFSLAVTAPDWRDRGRPSSWSAAVDQLAAAPDADGDEQRLIIAAAGNRRAHPGANHLDESDTETIHDPAQAWNAVSVGAYTDRFEITENGFEDWQPVAEPGELSPSSTTSMTWETQWPLKPEIVLEGGNMALSPDGKTTDYTDSLSLLTTNHQPMVKPVVPTGDTSAAAAQAARIAAEIRAAYPDFWPETIRALLIHSAEWTSSMRHRLEATTSKRARGQLVRRYGFGAPDATRAIRSAANALTLVAEEKIQPFANGKMNEMHLHSLPWPTDELRVLGSVDCRLRVTLSYFIAPNPGERGWKKKHQYASHGLRFEVKTPPESVAEFRRRINQMAVDEDGEKATSSSDSADWFLGSELRSKGSLHADIWTGSCAELADRGVIAVFPVSGWWKERKSDETCRYTLVVSIEVPSVDVDIYTPVQTKVPVSVEIPI